MVGVPDLLELFLGSLDLKGSICPLSCVGFLTGEEPDKTAETKNQTDDDKPRRPPPDFRGIMMFLNERFYGRVVTPE